MKLNNIVLTYKLPCAHIKVVSVQPMCFGISLGLDEKRHWLQIDFGNDPEHADITVNVDIEPENMWPLCTMDWWCGFTKYNLGWEILNIISASLAEHLSGHTDEYGDSPAEVDLNVFECEWEEKINEFLARIISKEEKEKEEKKAQEECHVEE